MKLNQVASLLRRLRRSLSRSVWLARLLRLPVSEGDRTRAGLIMVQIDGLSQPQFERALDRGEMPFLRRLVKREQYQIFAHYSGLPSTTPAVQTELFYGVKGAVPAFSFRDHESGHIVRMYEPDAAARAEKRYADGGSEALLKGGSAYSDNFTGGAAESHFCPSSIGWGTALRAANPLVVLIFLVGNVYSFLRVAVLLLLESGLALLDFFRGLIRGQDIIKELKFVPSRVGVSILLRELCVIGGKIDISRGLPVVHINFLGYDEQSHRRGPGSLFAHWTLKGIDDAIARLWRAAQRSAWRNYDVWVYSDHGQAAVRPYHQVQGYPLSDAVQKTFDKLRGSSSENLIKDVRGEQSQRARFLGGHNLQRLLAGLALEGEARDEIHPSLASLGPVGHVYSPLELSRAQRDFIALELAGSHNIPVVLNLEAPGILRARTSTGEFYLPRDCGVLFGVQHPFITALGEDLMRLCEHPDAGDFILLGWRDGVAPLTFAEENGAHAGLTPEETNGFALLPGTALLAEHQHGYLRPMDLRTLALRKLGRLDPETVTQAATADTQPAKNRY